MNDYPKTADEAVLHPATADLVDRFAAALREKLLAAQRKYGYSDNWARSDWMNECREHLRQHIHKGDPLDVAAYCAFLWHHGASTIAKTLTQLRVDCEASAAQQSTADAPTTGIEMIAPDGGRCFGYSVNEHGRAMCEWEGAFCECRKPSAREIPALELYVREKQAEYEGWGLGAAGVASLERARNRLSAARDSVR